MTSPIEQYRPPNLRSAPWMDMTTMERSIFDSEAYFGRLSTWFTISVRHHLVEVGIARCQ